MTAGGAARAAHEKLAGAAQGARGKAPTSFPHAPPAARQVLRPPRPAPSHLPLSQGVCVNLTSLFTNASDGDGARVRSKPPGPRGSQEVRGVVLQLLTSTRVCASLQVPLLLVCNFSYSPGEKKNVASIWYLHRILEGVDGFNYKC